jgi:protein-disulfide isomerase
MTITKKPRPTVRKSFLSGCLIALSFAALQSVGLCRAQECAPFSAEVKGRIAAYAVQQYQLAPDVRVEGGETTSNSCFRRIMVQGFAPKRSIELFLSPDQRFLTESLLDTSVNPAIERRRAATATRAVLLAERSPVRGLESALVTVVEFSDFQCPFCKRAADALSNLPEDVRDSVRVVFKHRPLPSHPWARRAALASICAGFQSDDAFWALDRFFFANQEAITAETLGTRIREFSLNDARLDIARLDGCLAAKSAEETLLRDEKLAQAYYVDVAPTMFINGVRKVGFYSPEDLWSALRLAAFDARGSDSQTPSRGDRESRLDWKMTH